MPKQFLFKKLLIFVNLYQHPRNQFTPSAHSSDIVTPFFDHAHPKNFQLPFNLRKNVTACKKSVNSICSFLRYRQFYSPEIRSNTSLFDYAQPKTFKSTFYFCEFVLTPKTPGCFINIFWKNN